MEVLERAQKQEHSLIPNTSEKRRNFILDSLKEATDFLRPPEIRQQIEAMNQTQWKKFVIQRLLMASAFMPLLQGAYHATVSKLDLNPKHAGYTMLLTALSKNIYDETGIDPSGNQPKQTLYFTHEEQRTHFAKGFGLDIQKDVYSKNPLPATSTYIDLINELIAGADAVSMSSALVVLEKQIPIEFGIYLPDLERKFTASFSHVSTNPIIEGGEFNPQIIQERDRMLIGSISSRDYLEDHMTHDSQHYADLFNALHAIANSDNSYTLKIAKTIKQVADAKQRFYTAMRNMVIIEQ